VSNKYVRRRFFKQFLAVVVGNVIYFFVLMPHLPAAGQHVPYRLDWGLLVDLWVCLVLYGIIELMDRRMRRRGTDGKKSGS